MNVNLPEIAKNKNAMYFYFFIFVLITIFYFIYLKKYINPLVIKYGIIILTYLELPMRLVRNNFSIIISIWIFFISIITLIYMLPILYNRK